MGCWMPVSFIEQGETGGEEVALSCKIGGAVLNAFFLQPLTGEHGQIVSQ